MVHRFGEPYLQLLGNLSFDLKESLGSHASQLLLDEHYMGVSVNIVRSTVRSSLRSFFFGSFKVQPILIKCGFSSLPKLRASYIGSIGSIFVSIVY